MSEQPRSGPARFLWLVPAVLISLIYLLLIPEAVYGVCNPHLRKGWEVDLSWWILCAGPVVLLLVGSLVRLAFWPKDISSG